MLAAKREPETELAPASPARPWDLAVPARIPVARPLLASAEIALPYLHRIDDARTYSNFGPLNAELEARLAAHYGLSPEHVVTCGNATLGLTLALQSVAGTRGGLCLMPAWTFTATAHAAVAAGLEPFLADVDPTTGALTPAIAEAALARTPRRVAAVMPVAPFGLSLDAEAWDDFQRRTGVPVVLDAAAGFDALQPGVAPAVVSLHATKVLGLGEGGFVIARDPEVIRAVRQRSNFGFAGARESAVTGGNAKLSEYAAAFGLAALDLWPVQRQRWMSALAYYRADFSDLPQIESQPGIGYAWATSTCCIRTPAGLTPQIERRLAEAGIATRRWWGRGLHGHPAFADAPRLDLSVTDDLAERTLGLPCYPDISLGELAEVTAAVRAALQP
jgi:dTDP-4-amino-4,6-dideoxygalactose transaminase